MLVPSRVRLGMEIRNGKLQEFCLNKLLILCEVWSGWMSWNKGLVSRYIVHQIFPGIWPWSHPRKGGDGLKGPEEIFLTFLFIWKQTFGDSHDLGVYHSSTTARAWQLMVGTWNFLLVFCLIFRDRLFPSVKPDSPGKSQVFLVNTIIVVIFSLVC